MKQELIDFGIKTLTEETQKAIDGLGLLYEPAKKSVTFYNGTSKSLEVKTYHEIDAVRWVAHEERKVAPNQVVQLTARGSTIQIIVTGVDCIYDCAKGKAYLFDGSNVHERRMN